MHEFEHYYECHWPSCNAWTSPVLGNTLQHTFLSLGSADSTPPTLVPSRFCYSFPIDSRRAEPFPGTKSESSSKEITICGSVGKGVGFHVVDVLVFACQFVPPVSFFSAGWVHCISDLKGNCGISFQTEPERITKTTMSQSTGKYSSYQAGI